MTERISFHDLSPTPHKERGKKVRRKIFTDPLMTADENMKIIESAHEKSLKKEQLEEEKSKVVKEHLKNKNASARGRRGSGCGGKIVDNPKL